ncbi:hypothetical protein SK128_025716 [Halocaridina rubra]|uniref:Immunoglobulin I-set domain-containing protein n=1 Tax=Halocaridina rubra TaxID=373956 RepID=A0AAN8XBQ0_HALRR
MVSNRGSLSISSAERHDAGIYRCTAASHLGRVAAIATLRVLGMYIFIMFFDHYIIIEKLKPVCIAN